MAASVSRLGLTPEEMRIAQLELETPKARIGVGNDLQRGNGTTSRGCCTSPTSSRALSAGGSCTSGSRSLPSMTLSGSSRCSSAGSSRLRWLLDPGSLRALNYQVDSLILDIDRRVDWVCLCLCTLSW